MPFAKRLTVSMPAERWANPNHHDLKSVSSKEARRLASAAHLGAWGWDACYENNKGSARATVRKIAEAP